MPDGFAFALPAVFLLLPLPWLLRYLPGATAGRALRFPSLHWAPPAARAARPALPAAAWLAWACLLAAAARPQLPAPQAPLPVSGRSLMLALDLSASMARRDLTLDGQPVERLAAAKAVLRHALAGRRGDRVGLIVFARRAYVDVPPTLDLAAVEAALDGAVLGLIGNETAIGDAIALATRQLRDQAADARVLVLLTDGANTAGSLSPQQAAWLARREGVRIHALGLGGDGVDETALQAVAAQTGGRYRRAADAAGLDAFLADLAAGAPLPDADPARRPPRELFGLPLLAAVLLAAWLAWRTRATADPWRQAVDAELLAELRPGAPAGSRLRLLAALLALPALAAGLLAALAAYSGPAYRAGALHVLVADLSAPATDEALRGKLATLLAELPPGEVVLLAYAGDAYPLVPPTADRAHPLALLPELAAEVMPLAGERPEAALAQLAALRARLGAPPVNTLWLTRTPARVVALPVAAGERRFLIDLAAPASADGSATALAALREAPVRWRLEALPAAAGLPAAGALLTLALLPLALLGLRRALLPAVLVAALLSPPADAAGDDPRWQAVADYRAGRYAEVVGALARLDDPVSHYNRGNALARLGRLAEAEAAYQASLAGRPGNPDALHNLELVRRLQAPAGGKPPPAAAMPEPAPAEAARLAAQWLRGVPDEPGGLLRAKLRLEHQRRLAAGDAR